MGKTINGRPILHICKLCGIKYGKNKKLDAGFPRTGGFCDICEAIGPINVPQSVWDIEAFRGLNAIDTAHLVDADEQ